jgi:Barstar (barnase inhibitor)
MSGLARLLAGHTPPGVYHWSSAADPDVVAHAAERTGWRFVPLDTWQVEDKDGFLDDWFGHNFDALDDALSDVRADDGAGVLVLWDGWAPLARSHRRVFDVALSVFADRVDFERGGAFAVLLHGPGPSDTDTPELDPHH